VPGWKFAPPTVIVVFVVRPAGTEEGDMVIAPSVGLFTAMEAALDVPPPGAGVTTVTERLPEVA
jgi:hypothetical protein